MKLISYKRTHIISIWRWGAVKKRGVPVLCVLLALTLCGYGKTYFAPTISYSDEACYETAEMRYYFDYENNTIYKEDLETGEVTELLRSPLAVMSDVQVHPTLYGVGNKVYCMMTATDSYIDRIGVFAGSVSRVSVIEIDTDDLTEQIIFERDISEKGTVWA